MHSWGWRRLHSLLYAVYFLGLAGGWYIHHVMDLACMKKTCSAIFKLSFVFVFPTKANYLRHKYPKNHMTWDAFHHSIQVIIGVHGLLCYDSVGRNRFDSCRNVWRCGEIRPKKTRAAGVHPGGFWRIFKLAKALKLPTAHGTLQVVVTM